MARYELASHNFRQAWPDASLNRRYGPDDRQAYDVFWPRDRQRTKGCTLFLHGGFWFSRHKDQFSFLAQAQAEAGWAFLVMTYPLMPQLTLTQLVDQTAAGIVDIDRQFRSDFGLGLSTVAGHSAGAHLVAMAFHSPQGQRHTSGMSAPPKRLVLVSGVYAPQSAAAASVNQTIGLTPEEAALNCPMTHCRPSQIPTWLFAGAREPEVWWQQGTRYQERLAKMGLRGRAQALVAGHDHFSLLEAMANPSSEIAFAMRGE